MNNNKIKKERENGWREIKSKKHLSNNIIALLLILFMLTSIGFNFIVYKNAETPFKLPKITGNTLNTAVITFCIGRLPPSVTILYPDGGEVISGIIDVNATASKRNEYENINTSFYYADEIDGIWTFVGIDIDDSDMYYNHSWDTTINVSDGNCIYKVFTSVYSNDSICPDLFSSDGSNSTFSINNIDVEPKWDNFKNNLTTNFSEFADPLTLGDWTVIENATIGIPNKGLINFSNQIINFDDADLDSNINISFNNISLNLSIDALPCLSRSAILTLYNLSFIQPKILADGEDCSSPQRNLTNCTIISYSNGNLIFNVTNFLYSYSAAENATVILDIWDQTDNITKYINDDTTFFANLSDTAYSNPINGTLVYCNIRFNLTGEYNEPVDMIFNHSSLLYEDNRSFSSPGTFNYLVFCNDSYYNFKTISKTDNFTIINRAPVLISIIPNATWNEDTILTGLDLDDYFTDPDGETLTYTSTKVPNINVSIDNVTHVVTYTPKANFNGNATVIFYAYDPHDARAESNIVYLFIIDVPEPVLTPPSGGGGGGGTTVFCEELWECTNWGACLPSGIQTRVCKDLAECGTEFRKPFESMDCEYVGTCSDFIKNCHDNSCETGVDCGGPCPPCPTCFDGIQNQGETGIDCGGLCPICPTCSDNIQNQGEESIDCGGPCEPCPSCSDGIKNCHHDLCEEKVDCGGPCPACKEIEIPAIVKKAIWPTLLLIILLILAIIFVIIKYHKYYQPFIAKILIKFVPFIVLFKKRKKQLPEELKERESILLRLDKLEKSIDKKSIDELSREFVRIVRDFLSDLLKIEYEFTYEELCKEIEKHKISTPLRIVLITFFKKISEISYKGYKITKPELRELINEARIIIKLGSEEYLEGKTKEEFKKNGLKEKQKIKKESKLMLEIYKDLIKAKRSIKELDIDSAKLAYIRIKELYEELPVKDKRKIYKKIVWLYNNIKERGLDKVKIN